MPEQTFRSPGFFEREIDQSQTAKKPLGTPAGIIGTSQRGPAFVPVTVGSFADWETIFGGLDSKKFGPYAVQKFLDNRNAITYVKVLGAGANDLSTDIETTRIQGTVKNAGFRLRNKNVSDDLRHNGAVQFLVARHFMSASSDVGYPIFTRNDSIDYVSKNHVNLVRAMIMVPSGTRVMIMSASQPFTHGMNDFARVDFVDPYKYQFKLIISSSTPGYANTGGTTGIRVLTASLNPSSQNYITKILNTDPERFITEEHLLYADFPVEDEVAPVSTASGSIGIVSGSSATSAASGDTTLVMRDLFGRFDTRYKAAKSPTIISQPFGLVEYDLFNFESMDDGDYGNTRVKISIADLKASIDSSNPYGTFTVLVRDFADTDTSQKVLERFPLCNLDPNSKNYVAKMVGDRKVYYNFDATFTDDRKLVISGKYPNKSRYIRIQMNDLVEGKKIPGTSLPFGFRGVELLKTTSTLTDTSGTLTGVGSTSTVNRFGAQVVSSVEVTANTSQLTGSILPPIPFRFKVTRGAVEPSPNYEGQPGQTEIADSRLYWGVKFEKVPRTGSISNAIYNVNVSSEQNGLIASYAKFLGIRNLDALVTGSAADQFCNNKFTLAKVALSAVTTASLTSSVENHMLEAAYIRNGAPDPTTYTVSDTVLTNRITMATLAAQTSSINFNKFTDYNKFSFFLYGGFDGVNILDKYAVRLNDKASSTETGGGANASYVSPGMMDASSGSTNISGAGKYNNIVASYRAASRIMTDPMASNINIMAIPGIREPLITDNAADQIKSFGLGIYVMDIPEYDDSTIRLFDDDTGKPDVQKTADQFGNRAIDNNYVSTYFPNVFMNDPENNRIIEVPASIPAVAAYGFNDRVGYPWFAPAGFNRASLDFVKNIDVRLTSNDKNVLYDARINPIASFPQGGFVIMGQKTLQAAKSALDRVNVRRMMIEVKRQIIAVANTFVFEQNTPAARAQFKSLVAPKLNFIQSQSGIERASVVMDETNNSDSEINANRLNGRIVIVPTRTIEFIAIDFIITNSGVQFAQ